MKNFLKAVACYVRARRKAIAAGASALATYVSIHVFAHDIDPTVKAAILTLVPLFIVHAIPNTECADNSE